MWCPECGKAHFSTHKHRCALTRGRPANAEMVQGFMDGYDKNAPEPSTNRSASYRHGFKVGRADITHTRLGTFEQVTAMADAAMAEDEKLLTTAEQP